MLWSFRCWTVSFLLMFLVWTILRRPIQGKDLSLIRFKPLHIQLLLFCGNILLPVCAEYGFYHEETTWGFRMKLPCRVLIQGSVFSLSFHINYCQLQTISRNQQQPLITAQHLSLLQTAISRGLTHLKDQLTFYAKLTNGFFTFSWQKCSLF